MSGIATPVQAAENYSIAVPPPPPGWPKPLAPEALRGLAGDFVRLVEPHTESDSAAILLQFLAAVGNIVGPGPHFTHEASRHAFKIFMVLVGVTAKARKGTSWSHVRKFFKAVDPSWRVVSGLSSGEGLVYAVRDPQDDEGDEGETDKRLFVVETEFASPLQAAARDGNTLSTTIRVAWDSGEFETLTKNSALRASGVHVSLLGHITTDELHRRLVGTERTNGFANRFLWACARRSKLIPDGGTVPAPALKTLERRLADVLEFSRGIGDREFRRNPEARDIWRLVYPALTAERPGLLGAITSRCEAYTMRLACIFALLDQADEVAAEHLNAAIAVWKYCEESARFIFGDATGDTVADALLNALRAQGNSGLTKAQLHKSLGNHCSASMVDAALALLARHHLARAETRKTQGRPCEIWVAAEGDR